MLDNIQRWKPLRRQTTAARTYNTGAIGVDYTQAVPVWIPADVTAVRLRRNQFNYLSGAGGGDCVGIDAGIGKSDGAGGYADDPWTQLDITVASGLTDTVGPWVYVQNKRGSDGKVILAQACSAGTSMVTTTAETLNGLRKLFERSVDPLPTAMVASHSSILRTILEMYSTAPQLIVQGDSESAGFATSGDNGPDWSQVWSTLLGSTHNYVVDNGAVPSTSCADWNGNAYLSSEQQISGNPVVVELGINDVIAGYNLATYQASVATRVAALQGAGASRIVWCTIPPSLAGVANDAQRQLMNAWLLGGVAGIDAVADISTALQKPADHTMLDPAYDSGDGTHWNAAGHAVVMPIIYAGL